jgi:hypothetical protein
LTVVDSRSYLLIHAGIPLPLVQKCDERVSGCHESAARQVGASCRRRSRSSSIGGEPRTRQIPSLGENRRDQNAGDDVGDVAMLDDNRCAEERVIGRQVLVHPLDGGISEVLER